MPLDAQKVHSGSGRITRGSEVVGEASRVNFIIQTLGLEETGDTARTCYGTVSGRITKTGLVADLNSPPQSHVDLQLVLSSEKGKGVKIVGIEFVDEVPRDGELDDLEFHGMLSE
jgi:hypothetical protein